MTIEQENKLYTDFPKMFRQKDLPMTETCMCWGIECPSEWFDIIYGVCETLQSMTDNNKDISDKYPQVEFTQVKEKFGSLCMYNNVNSDYVNGVLDLAETMVQKLNVKNGYIW